MSDFFGSDEFWLDLTNIALGVTTLVCLVAVVRVVLQEIAERRKVNAFVTRLTDDHVFAVPGLGITMADGGKRIEHEEPMPVWQNGSHPRGQHSPNSNCYGEEWNIIRSEN